MTASRRRAMRRRWDGTGRARVLTLLTRSLRMRMRVRRCERWWHWLLRVEVHTWRLSCSHLTHHRHSVCWVRSSFHLRGSRRERWRDRLILPNGPQMCVRKGLPLHGGHRRLRCHRCWYNSWRHLLRGKYGREDLAWLDLERSYTRVQGRRRFATRLHHYNQYRVFQQVFEMEKWIHLFDMTVLSPCVCTISSLLIHMQLRKSLL